MSATAAPAIPIRHSPIADWQRAAGAGSQLREGMSQPLGFGSEVPVGPAVTLEDASWRRRFGLKGPMAQAWLEERRLAVPAPSNSWIVTDGILIGRLATSEFLVEALGGSQARVAGAAADLGLGGAGVYPVARQDLVLSLSGEALPDLLRQVCSVDFSPLLAAARPDSGALVLTSMIGVSVVAVPRGGGAGCTLTLWSDPSFAHYFWTTLVELAADLGGGVRLDDPNGA